MANDHSQIVPSMQPTSTVADFKFWCQKVLPLVYDDSLSYYEVLNKMVVYLNQVIDNINADTANVAELEDDFLLLQTYVNNFFDDIDQLVTYTERAEAAQTAAATSAINAATSASNSATSASNSAGSASSAATSALSALDAKDAAVAAKTAAETALANAQTAATNAAASATAASGSATNAAASAASALQNFQLSDAARTAAQSAASSAESDAENAADSAAEAVAAVDTIVNGLGTIAKTIENVPIAHVEDALASYPKKLAVDIVPVQSGSGDPSPENVRPITGWTETNIYDTGVNVWDEVWELGGIHDTTGQNTPNSNVIRSKNYIPVIPETNYYFKCDGWGGNNNVRTRFYDSQKNYLGYLQYGETPVNKNNVFKTPENCYYMRFVTPDSYGTEYNNNISINYPSTNHEYHTYNGEAYNVTFPVAAGTVYGGTLMKQGTDEWKLRVTDASVDMGSLTWTKNANLTYSTFDSASLTSVIKKNSNTVNAICSCYYSTSNSDASQNENNRLFIDTNGQARAKETSKENLTPEEYTTYITGQMLVYKLATPVEYTLTETQVITLLNGINNVWADTGNIKTLEYFTNAENYITSQINLAKALIAPVLKEMKADTALVANDFRIAGNTLYRITGNISSGGTLTPNTNCVATTVGAILKSLLSA